MELEVSAAKLTGDPARDIKSLSNHVFMLEEKLRYTLRNLDVTAAAQEDGSVKVLVNPEAESGCSWYYKLGDAAENVTYEQAVSTWSKLEKSGAAIAVGANKAVTVVEAGSDGKAKAVGCAILN